ncbi:helix-turn-helix transcriptional regulator, partial [Jatrophihabitans sp. YIM 134969]
GDHAAAAAAALGAARGLTALAAYGEAWTHYRTVLATPTGDDPLPLALEAAEAARLAGEPGAAADVLATAMSATPADPPGPAHAAALERVALYRWEAGRPSEAMAAFEAADAALGPGLSAVHAQVWAGRARAAFIMARFDEAVRDADRAVAAARAVSPGSVLADALVTRGTAAVVLGDETGLTPLLEGVELARAGGDAGVLCRAYSNLVVAYEYTGQVDLAVETSLEGLRVLPEHGLELVVGAALASNATNMLIRRGRYAECAAILDDLLVGRAVRGQALHLYIEKAALQLAMGDVPGARASLAASTPLLAADEPAIVVAIAETTAECFRQEQDFPNCYATVVEALERTEDPHYRSALALIGLRAEADRPGPRTDPDTVARRERLLAAFEPPDGGGDGDDDDPDHDVNLRAERVTAFAEAGRAAGDDDPARWTRAVHLWREAARPHDEAWCLIRQAEAYVDRRDRAAATEAVARGRAIAERLPAAPLLAAADALVRRARLTLPGDAEEERPPPATSGTGTAYGLTAREIDVLDLLGDGSTNREIAQRLFISERTVGVHVTNLLRKLGAANRTQAAAFAARIPADHASHARRP